MDRALALLLAAAVLLFPGGAAFAQAPGAIGARVVATTSWVEEWDPATQTWVRVDDHAAAITPTAYPAASSGALATTTTTPTTTTTERLGHVTMTETVRAQPARFIARTPHAIGQMRGAAGGQRAGLAQFGPFRVLDQTRAALVATTDAASVPAFAAMLAAFPGLRMIEFADAPGTNNDLANLALGRAIRAAGLATHVPDGGSARSGAVELFLAGTRRTIAPRALFAVHSWRDERGREPADFAPDAPENRLYLDYYAEMGMDAAAARAFYEMTNSVPHAGALWLEGDDMARWIAPDQPARLADPILAAAVRLALTQAGAALVDAARGAWPLPRVQLAALRPELPPAPTLAYADLGTGSPGLLDSSVAFP